MLALHLGPRLRKWIKNIFRFKNKNKNFQNFQKKIKNNKKKFQKIFAEGKPKVGDKYFFNFFFFRFFPTLLIP
jgi:hypothetical protein